jgi:effector-binding domain-containing protein
MKWLVRGFFVITVLAGVIVIGGVFLPSRAHVERSMAVDRPPATVFTLLSSLKTFHDWSPWAALEPDAIFAFDGPEFGPGARYQWAGDSIGQAAMTVTGAEPYSFVEARIDLGARGRARMRFDVEAKPGGSQVRWSYDADFGLDLIGRYVGRSFDARIGRELEAGLIRLKAYAERLPGADFADADAEIVEVAPVPVVAAGRQVRGGAAELEAAFAMALAEVRRFMADNGLPEAGPPAVVTQRWEPPLWVFEAAVPYSGAPLEIEAGDIRFDELPGGRALRGVHHGPSAGVAPLGAKLEAYLRAHRLTRAGPSWELRVTEREGVAPEDQITELYIPVE